MSDVDKLAIKGGKLIGAKLHDIKEIFEKYRHQTYGPDTGFGNSRTDGFVMEDLCSVLLSAQFSLSSRTGKDFENLECKYLTFELNNRRSESKFCNCSICSQNQRETIYEDSIFYEKTREIVLVVGLLRNGKKYLVDFLKYDPDRILETYDLIKRSFNELMSPGGRIKNGYFKLGTRIETGVQEWQFTHAFINRSMYSTIHQRAVANNAAFKWTATKELSKEETEHRLDEIKEFQIIKEHYNNTRTILGG